MLRPPALIAASVALPLTAQALPMMPLAEGTRWTYEVTDSRHEESWQETTWVWGEVPLRTAGSCTQLVRRIGQVTEFEYWRVDERGGVFRHDSAVFERMRGPDDRSRNMLPLPVGIETRWEWTVEGDAVVEEDPVSSRITCRAELVAPATSVTVPLGTFDATHVRIRSECSRWLDARVRELWFVRGKGLVRERTTEGEHVVVRELTAFTPGAPAPPAADRDAATRAHVQNLPDWPDGDVELIWLKPSLAQCYVKGVFGIARSGARQTCVWFDGTAATPFRAGDRAFWHARWLEAGAIGWAAREAEPVPGQPDAGHDDDTWALHALARAAGQLHGTALGYTRIEPVTFEASVTAGPPPISCETKIEFAATDAAGRPTRLTATMEARDKWLRKVAFGDGD